MGQQGYVLQYLSNWAGIEVVNATRFQFQQQVAQKHTIS